jgi:hypothetical protein
MRVLRPGTTAGGAGSRRISPGWWSAVRWCAGLTPALERLDDDHVSTAAWARQTGIERLFRHVVIERWRDRQQFACTCEAGLARRTGEQAVVANAVEPARQDVKQEAADELVDAERHDLLAVRAVAAIVLVAEGDAGLVEGEQPAVRDGDAVTYLTSAARSGRLVSCQTILSWPSTLKPPPKAPVPVNVYA